MQKIDFNFVSNFKKKKESIDGGLRKTSKKKNLYFLLLQ